MNNFVVSAFLCLYFSAASGQVTPLTIGDTLPNLSLKNTTNAPVFEIQLPAAFPGKFLILDFWSSYCGACITLFPHLQRLQDRFADRLQIVLVNTKTQLTGDNEAATRAIFARLQRRTGLAITLPLSFDNPLLDSLFPATSLPHEVIIDPGGRVVAITDAEALTEANIAALLADRPVSLRHKRDQLDFDSRRPLFIRNNGGDGSPTLARSLLTGYIEGLGTADGVHRQAGHLEGKYVLNASRLDLARAAYPALAGYPGNRVHIESGDPGFAVSRYCYDLILPGAGEDRLRQAMQQDLRRYFNLQLLEETRWVDCWQLSGQPKLVPAHAAPSQDLQPETVHKFIYGRPLSYTLDLLNRFTPLPLVSEVTGDPVLSLDFAANLDDFSALQAAFRRVGLTLTLEKRRLPVAILTDQIPNP